MLRSYVDDEPETLLVVPEFFFEVLAFVRRTWESQRFAPRSGNAAVHVQGSHDRLIQSDVVLP